MDFDGVNYAISSNVVFVRCYIHKVTRGLICSLGRWDVCLATGYNRLSLSPYGSRP